MGCRNARFISEQVYIATRRPPIPPYQPMSVSVESCAELDTFLLALAKQVEREKTYQVWFRGQTDDHLLEDLGQEASLGICPWRTRRDSSLVPTLYRQLPRHLNDLRSYAQFCREYGLFSLFMKFDLSVPDYTARKSLDPVYEFLNDE